MKKKNQEQKSKNNKIKKNNDKHLNSLEENEENELEDDYNPKLDPKQIIAFDYYLDTIFDLKFMIKFNRRKCQFFRSKE